MSTGIKEETKFYFDKIPGTKISPINTMKKTEYIVLTMPGKCVFGMSEKETNKHMEAAWNELRTKTLAMGKPFMNGDKLEMPNGRFCTLDLKK